MFDWDAGNRDHIALHGITAAECEEALADPRLMPLGGRRVAGENRHGMIGSTDSGRLLVVIFTARVERLRG
jgi:uncharacterized DUF497 family protein